MVGHVLRWVLLVSWRREADWRPGACQIQQKIGEK